jgi:hypothetical protein
MSAKHTYERGALQRNVLLFVQEIPQNQQKTKQFLKKCPFDLRM